MNFNSEIKYYPSSYTLYIYLEKDMDESIKKLYRKSSCTSNENYFKKLSNTFDAGYDLFLPENVTIENKSTKLIDYKIKCAMKMGDRYVGYYLYPRSSTGTKTPLRMSNSIGIIDSGYRGNLKVSLDNIYFNNKDFNMEKGNRYIQICPPNLEYPIKTVIVNNIDDLGVSERDIGGFGSTGK
jgi:dUTP pyrophosphatase|tara:strand:- start:653 stop:1198 length:546 start_codon:yes stop_codon:yes gene_type:complete